MVNIKYIFFDIDNTLFPTSEFSELARKNAIRAMIEIGLPIKDSNKLYLMLLKIIEKLGSNSDQHFTQLLRELKIKNPSRYIAAAIAAYHNTKTSILPYPDVPSTLLNLREQGYKLYIATNGNAIKQWDKLIRLGIALYFQDVFVSEEVGIEKSKEFFDKVIVFLNIKPEECVMIGDKEENDIYPAKESGFNSIIRKDKYKKNQKSLANFIVSDFFNLLDIIKKL